MGYQFIHMEAYARKADTKGRDVSFVIAEASRRSDASIHVSSPLRPKIVHGIGLEELQQLHDSAVASALTEVAGGKQRKLRQDQKTLHTVVASHPATMDEIRDDPEVRKAAEDWENRTIDWLRQQYGDDLMSIVRHEDESHFHIPGNGKHHKPRRNVTKPRKPGSSPKFRPKTQPRKRQNDG